MPLIEKIITSEEINSLNVKSVEGRYLRGTVQQNKNVFDKLPEFIAEHINGLIQTIIDDGADGIQIQITDPDGDGGKTGISLKEYLERLREFLTYMFETQVTDEDGNPINITEYVSFQDIITHILGDLERETASDRVTHLNGLSGNIQIEQYASPPDEPVVGIYVNAETGKIGLRVTGALPGYHAGTHEPGGSDPIAGAVPASHADTHEPGGSDPIARAIPDSHASTHLNGESDSLTGVLFYKKARFV